MTMGERIKTLREAQRMTQEELGKLCDTTKQTIFKYETGIVTNIPFDRLDRLASVLGVSPAYIVGWELEKVSENERKLVKAFREMSESGQEKILEYVEDLKSGGKYMKLNR